MKATAAATCAALFWCHVWHGLAAQGSPPEKATAACEAGGGGSSGGCATQDPDVMNAMQYRAGRSKAPSAPARRRAEASPLAPKRSPCGADPCGTSRIQPKNITTITCGPFKWRWAPPSEELVEPAVARSSKGQLVTSLIVQSSTLTFPEIGLKVTTRTYNGTLPGPTLSVKRGDLMQVNLINTLEPNNYTAPPFPIPLREGQVGVDKDDLLYQDVGQSPKNKTLMIPKTDNFHNVNNTNLHVHGWHVSPNMPQDNVVTPKVKPGENYTYKYELSPYHMSGNSWYHGHRHGTTAVQAGGGAAGALIIETERGELADWIFELPVKLLVISEQTFQYVGPDAATMAPGDPWNGCYPLESGYAVRCALQHRQDFDAMSSGDRLFKIEQLPGVGCGDGELPPIRHWLATNGQYAPYITLKTGEWVRLRFVYLGHNSALRFIFGDLSDDCEFQLIAKDTVYLPKYPRKLRKGIYFGPGSRCQVLVRCSKPGEKVIRNDWEVEQAVEDLPDPMREQPVLYLNVVKGAPNHVCKPSCQLKPLPSRCNHYLACGGCEGCYPSEEPLAPVEQYTMKFPKYLADLVDLPPSELAEPSVTNQYRDDFITQGLLLDNNLTLNQRQIYDFPNGPPPRSPLNVTLNGVTFFNPGQPGWEQSNVRYPVRFTINNGTYSEPTEGVPPSLDKGFQARIPVGQVLQFNVSGLQVHAWHMHTNPIQIVKFGKENFSEFWGGYFEVGDWHDTLFLNQEGVSTLVATPETSLLVRFHTDCYNGIAIAHCHVLYHEDLGMFTQLHIEGPDFTPARYPNEGIFRDPPPHCLGPDAQCPAPKCANYVYPQVWVNPDPIPTVPTQDYQYLRRTGAV